MFKVDGVVNRVKCKTCGAEHKYRGTMPGVKNNTTVRSPGAAKVKKPMAAKVTVNDAPRQWDLKSRNMPPGTPIQDYSIKDTFKVNNIINHLEFGIGFVEKVASDKSIFVLFHDTVRLMGMNVS
jgi:hypothetical protein